MIVFVVVVSILGTAAILGVCYMFYEIVKDMLHKEPEKVEEAPAPVKLKFKKPNL